MDTNKKSFFIINSSRDLKKINLSATEDTFFDHFGKIDILQVGDVFTTKFEKGVRSNLFDNIDKILEIKLKKYYNYIFINSLADFVKYLDEKRGSVALAGFSDTWHNWYILYLSKKYNIHLIRKRTKSAGFMLYSVEKKLLKVVFNRSIFKAILYKVLLFLINIKVLQKIDSVFISDIKTYQKHKNHPYYANLIKVNSYHYDNFIKNNYTPSKDYIVFIDSNAVYHPDAEKYTYKKIDAKLFFSKLNRFFDILEEVVGKEVIVCAHPIYDMKNAKIDYPNRKVYNNRSEEFIAKAELVLYNFSTMVNAAFLYNKPIIQLYTDDFTGWWEDHFNNMQESFHHPVIDFYNANKQDIERSLKLLEEKKEYYSELNKKYISDNLAFSEEVEKSSGDIIVDRIKQILQKD